MNGVRSALMDTITVPEIIDSFGGAAAFARAIGIKPSTASEMKRRRGIPVPHWPRLVAADPIDRPRYTYADLVEAHCQGRAGA